MNRDLVAYRFRLKKHGAIEDSTSLLTEELDFQC